MLGQTKEASSSLLPLTSGRFTSRAGWREPGGGGVLSVSGIYIKDLRPVSFPHAHLTHIHTHHGHPKQRTMQQYPSPLKTANHAKMMPYERCPQRTEPAPMHTSHWLYSSSQGASGETSSSEIVVKGQGQGQSASEKSVQRQQTGAHPAPHPPNCTEKD